MATQPEDHEPDAIESAAADWIARGERGLSPAEESAFRHWRESDPRHAAALARLTAAWSALDRLGVHHALHGTPPEPDFLEPVRPGRRFRWMYAGLGMAAAAAIAAAVWFRAPVIAPALTPVAAAAPRVKVIPSAEMRQLPDGSTVELNHAVIEVAYTDGERRVRLKQGEAHFSVAKNPRRPFVVDTGDVQVRAVGTAFDVARREAAIEVLVTEGKVQVERARADLASAPMPVSAGQRAYVDVAKDAAATAVEEMPWSDMDRALGWRSVRLEFLDMPLADVVAEFNRRNSLQLSCGDAETARVLVGGSFRADQVEAFVRIIEKTTGVAAQKQPNGVIELKLSK